MTESQQRSVDAGGLWVPDVVVLVGGPPASGDPVPWISAHQLAAARSVPVIAADGGVAMARALDLTLSVVVGDLDSVGAADLHWAEAQGATVHRHHPDKDATDLELALDVAALAVPSGRLLVLGPGGGRLDHLLGDLLVVAGPLTATWSVRAQFGPAQIAVARPHETVELVGAPREHVSLFALTGPVTGITTTGLRWPLHGGRLDPAAGSLRSNEIIGTHATVAVTSGDLVVVRPGTIADPFPDREAW